MPVYGRTLPPSPQPFPAPSNDRESWLQHNITPLARRAFPDHPTLFWVIRRWEHRGDFSYVEALPCPDDAGYSFFRFVVRFQEGAEPDLVGCSVLELGKPEWSLLFGQDPGRA